jgi:hypothetical protein
MSEIFRAKPVGGVANQRFRQRVEIADEEVTEQDKARIKRELVVVRWVGTALERWYPGHAWHVQVHGGRKDPSNAVIAIRINALMPAHMWITRKYRDCLNDPSGIIIRSAAGELLERYGIPRAGFDLDHWRQALNAMPLLGKIGKGHKAPLLA